MKRKHILALIIAVCLVLAGCSNSSNSNKDGDKKNLDSPDSGKNKNYKFLQQRA